MIHELKTWPYFFNLVWAGQKNWELRINDRGFAMGDTVLLQEYDPQMKCYTGLKIRAVITSMLGAGSRLADQVGGLEEGYCILGIRVVSKEG